MADEFVTLELEHWSLVGNKTTGKLAIYIDMSLWRGARPGAGLTALRKAMGEAITSERQGMFGLVPMDDHTLRRLAAPADKLARAWRAEWCSDCGKQATSTRLRRKSGGDDAA